MATSSNDLEGVGGFPDAEANLLSQFSSQATTS